MKIKNIIPIVLLFVSLVGCTKKLALLPEQDLADEVVFNSVGTAESALRGVYSTAQTLEFYGSLPQVIDDFMGNNVEFVGTFPTLQELNNFAGISTNLTVQDIWRFHYEVILRANKVIARVPSVPGISEAQVKQFTGEAKFLRALAYFQLANLFSQPFQVSSGSNLCVPLVLEEFNSEITYPSRSSLNEVHSAIENDLKEAVELLPTQYESLELSTGRATKGAAYALLSRLYLYRDQNSLAVSSAQSAIDLGFYSLQTTKDVFLIRNSAIDNGRTGSGGWASYYNPAALGGRGDAPFSNDLIALFEQEPSDNRFAKVTGVATDGLSHLFTTKYPDATNNSDNSPVLRTAELYLNKAEALAKEAVGISPDAVIILNDIRAKAGLTAKAPLSKADLIELILIERTKELAFEGHSRMDLLRNRKNLRTNEPKAIFGANNTILPIPQREIDNNPGLSGQQNPGY